MIDAARNRGMAVLDRPHLCAPVLGAGWFGIGLAHLGVKNG